MSDHNIPIRFTEEDYQRIKAYAEARRMSVSGLCRFAVLYVVSPSFRAHLQSTERAAKRLRKKKP